MTTIEEKLRARFPRMSEATIRLNAAMFAGREAAAASPPPLSTAPVPAATPAQPKPPKRAAKRQKVARTRNLGTMTEAMFWGKVRSELRRAFRWWKPALEALKRQRIASKGPRGRKWLYRCEGCGKLFLRSAVQIDHRIPCGTLTDYAHVGEFLRRLCPESPDDFRILCRKVCHQQKTNAERTK